MAGFNFEAAMRWTRKFGAGTLARRATAELPWLSPESVPDNLLFDTSVYIDRMQGNLPDFILDVVDVKMGHHSSVALQEILISIGNLDPKDHRTASAVKSVSLVMESINKYRLHGPDVDTSARAALLAGTLARIQGYGRENRARALNDCTLFLQSQKLGITLLTRNYADFDILLQMMPSGRVLFY